MNYNNIQIENIENIDIDTLQKLLWYLDEIKADIPLYDKEGNPTPYKDAWDRMAHIVLIPEVNNLEEITFIKSRVELKNKDFNQYWETLNLK